MVIFFPVWVDIFGENKKTIWLSILQVGVPLGIFLGYILTVFSVEMLNVYIKKFRPFFIFSVKILVEMGVLATNNPFDTQFYCFLFV